jgi:hypothetical protein
MKNMIDNFIDKEDEDYLENLATQLRINKKKPKEGYKNCLLCNIEFKSEGKHNRLCLVCRETNGIDK